MNPQPITVAELIAHLQTLPAELPCIFRCCSDYDPLLAEQITVDEVSYRQGRHCNRYPPGMYGDEKPDYRKAVTFPGN